MTLDIRGRYENLIQNGNLGSNMHVIANEGRTELINNVKVTTQRIRLGSSGKDKGESEKEKKDLSDKAANGSIQSEIKSDIKTINYNEIYNAQKYYKQKQVRLS
jgi:hypothetical protein